MIDYTKSFGASSAAKEEGLKKYMLGIYQYVSIALAITGVSAFLAMSQPFVGLIFNVTSSGYIVGFSSLGSILSFSPLAIAIYFFWGIGSMKLENARILFYVYATLMGISLSSLGLIYTGQSIVRTFFICSSAFAVMSIYGYTTQRNLAEWGSFLTVGLIGLLVVSLINILLQSPAIYFATSIIGVLIFLGMIAWDTQKIKNMYYNVRDPVLAQKYAIVAAFSLYLDFINLFLYLLRFFGTRRD
jgi:FtsH-binding integral membrane protein